jgi:glycosyltransferase involved in cell wall biosynthesis
MNVLFLTTHLNAGGITSYLLTLAKGMRERGVEVHLASGGGRMGEEFSSLGTHLLSLDIRTKSELDFRIYNVLPRLHCYMKQHNIDILHAQTRITQVMGHLLKSMTGRPYVSTCHGFFKRRLSRRLFPCWGDAVIAISEAVYNHLARDFHVDEGRAILIKSGIDVGAYAPAGEETKRQLRRKYNLGEGPVIGNIARLSDVKGHDVLIAAMPEVVSRIPSAKLLIAGDGKMEKMLKEMVQTLKLEDHVLFASIVHKTADLLPAMDVFVMPSRQEGLGLSIMEAQAAGLPVIASNVGGIPSLIEHGKTGVLVDPESPSALARAIIDLCGDEKRLRDMGGAGRESALRHYGADRMVEETLNLYSSLAKFPLNSPPSTAIVTAISPLFLKEGIKGSSNPGHCTGFKRQPKGLIHSKPSQTLFLKKREGKKRIFLLESGQLSV